MRLTAGKFLGLSRISRDGFFTMLALDHRGSFRKLVNPQHPELVGFGDVVSMKKEMVSVLGPEASAILLDPEYGLFPSVYANVLSSSGLLVSLEQTGYGETKSGRTTKLLPKWGVSRIKKLGADGVKLLLFYNPEYKRAARAGERLVRKVARECRRHDILFLLEPLSYSLSEPKESPEFAKRKPEIVVKTAQTLSRLGIDVLKSEFPEDLRQEVRPERALESAKKVDIASAVPWVILSEGVTYPVFKRQVELASAAGASGFLAGRAIWQEALVSSDFKGFLRNESLARLKELSEIVRTSGTPWTKRVELPHEAVRDFHGFYKKY